MSFQLTGWPKSLTYERRVRKKAPNYNDEDTLVNIIHTKFRALNLQCPQHFPKEYFSLKNIPADLTGFSLQTHHIININVSKKKFE